MSAVKVTRVHDEHGEWEGLYVDGTLVDEGHSLDTHDVLTILGKEFEFEVDEVEANGEWMEENGRLPTKLSQVQAND